MTDGPEHAHDPAHDSAGSDGAEPIVPRILLFYDYT